MPPRGSKRKSVFVIPRETEEEQAALVSGVGPSRRAEEVIQESTSLAADGSVRYSTTVVRGVGTTEGAEGPANVILRADMAREEPLYDQVELEGSTEPRDGSEGGRALRDSDDPLRAWAADHVDRFLQELLRGEGRGDHRVYTVCKGCQVGEPEHRCKDCMGGGELLCEKCVVERHKQLPFHRIEKWMGTSFMRTTLKQMKLRIQLGHWHEEDARCTNPERAPGDDFVIVHDHGVHEVGLDYCGCGRSGTEPVQLLRAGLFPATSKLPRTAATFSVLRRFHLLSFESKCSAYEFYYSLARETDNTGLEAVKDRYHEFLRMTREWRHLQMLKRAGRGHDPEGIANTKEGECALLCPACPQPGKNLPPDWKECSPEKEFLYALYLAIDANFRLKRKDVSSEEKDPGLGKGWAFFCEVKAYMKHVKTHWKQEQKRSHCVAHDAVDKPDREARGTASSGIGAIDCARHNMKRPCAVGDLQLGERYINMDYMFLKSIAGTELLKFFISYDIACQWHINIWKRMNNYKNEEITIPGKGRFFTFLVPKFHLPAHIEECNLRFSFNLTRDVGLTDGEAPERGWANTNPVANSTKEMGPGSRCDTLDDHFNDWNHKKIIGLGDTMLGRTVDAVPMMIETREALKEFERSLDEETLVEWRTMAEAWEADIEKPNPFESFKKDEHLAQVRTELATEAAARELAGIEVIGAVREDMHVTELLAMGLQLEEQQRVMRFDVAATGLHPSEKARAAMVERTSKLRRKIFAWMDIQKLFFPVVEILRKADDDARARTAESQPVPGVKVYELDLWLPSALKRRPGGASSVDGCTDDILSYEYRMRVGQANEALHEVRRNLLVRTHLYKRKDLHARGVKRNTRAQTKLDGVEERIRRAAAAYRDAWAALKVLGRRLGRNEWEVALKELKPENVRGQPRKEVGDVERQQGRKGKKKDNPQPRLAGEEMVSVRQGRKKRLVERPMSWIWLAQVQGAKEGEPQQKDEALRIEWAKTRARSLRWTEEVLLLEEEMRRISQFLLWRSEWWLEQVGRRGLEDGPQAEGENAYALRQSALQVSRRGRFEEKWAALPALIQSGRVVAQGVVGEPEVDEEEQGDERGDEQDEHDGALASDDEEPVPEFAVRPVVVVDGE
ncbi:hypothetical protein DFH07DRAFT_953170 [Mycena maculata]|uniref:CxC2-like cysteine cluster KDZ transposase-associated domain-containing protein n=1 Tax=Mycena maculata TaxID=230809 RepID=A0AAD7JXT9_9AGAR|nr:hypothetical protein DFH07DRAFT_953170 [Mycena maculata]